MSPRILKEGELIFWFHSYDALVENRASVHVGKGSQNDAMDAKIWLEPAIEIARFGRTLNRNELNRAMRIAEVNHTRLQEAWRAHKGQTT